MRSPIPLALVLGVVVGAGAVAAIATTSSDERRPPSAAAPAPVLPPSTDPAPGSVERLAAAFDIHTPVAVDADGWLVRDGDRVLRVRRMPGLPWVFATTNPSCVVVPETVLGSEPLPTVPLSGPAECPETAPIPKDDALALGTDTLARAGLRSSTTDIVDDPGGWYIQAEPRADAKSSVGLPWTVSIGPGRTVTAASGYLAVENR